MDDFVIMWEWFAFAVRWLHVTTAIAWIGSSFYFIALDLGLKKSPNLPAGAYGEEWQVHGGGFYHIQKYSVAPENMPNHLTWFKWESYATWLSGAAMLMIVYWLGAELYLIDPAKADLSVFQAIIISAGSLLVGWVVYDFLCKSALGNNPTGLMLLLFVVLVVMSWGYNQIFTGRAAMLHLGAFTATIMSANVFLIIMPNQRIVVKDLKEGRTPDPKYGKIAKLRSTHNNYLTLPVLFLMLSNHYPLAFATEYTWIIASLVFLTGVTIRHYFNTLHATGSGPTWTWMATLVLFLIIAALSTASSWNGDYDDLENQPLTKKQESLMLAKGFDDISDIIISRCSMCHAREPVWDGMINAPKGVFLETDHDIVRGAKEIYIQAGVSHAMPPANITNLANEDRIKIVKWFRAAVPNKFLN
ncbi:urate hydroxylase PuuD [Amylibacter sp.]|nr:urate hydroxylase PuuD [Amylibacter sp.]MDA9253337.1 urate hydroxylase PuuD [Amylibacter sp.]MDA9269298.1 urate hydroxylase PuuD [Amylibacter sp.]MDB4008951.1 urate hydroxylase PuuD [Amylibacter sp.]MDC1294595.1 urate hydroxylase PuuD [Amylibacter sp.]